MDAMNYLLENGADLSRRNDLDQTPIDEVVIKDNFDLFECLY